MSTALLLLFIAAPVAAQNQTPPQTPEKSHAAMSAKMEDVANWTKQQWYAAKAKWVKEKVKWADCQTQAVEKKIYGRKSWIFLYGCMTKS